MKAVIKVRLKNVILDPQGKTVQQALEHLGYDNVSDVRVGKLIEFQIDSQEEEKVKQMAREMADRLLANPVMETYDIEVIK